MLSFWRCPARFRRLLTPMLAAAESGQDVNDKSTIICPLFMGSMLSLNSPPEHVQALKNPGSGAEPKL